MKNDRTLQNDYTIRVNVTTAWDVSGVMADTEEEARNRVEAIGVDSNWETDALDRIGDGACDVDEWYEIVDVELMEAGDAFTLEEMEKSQDD